MFLTLPEKQIHERSEYVKSEYKFNKKVNQNQQCLLAGPCMENKGIRFNFPVWKIKGFDRAQHR